MSAKLIWTLSEEIREGNLVGSHVLSFNLCLNAIFIPQSVTLNRIDIRRKPGDVNPVLLILSKNSHRIREGFSATTEHLIISNLTQCIEDGWYSKQWNATLYVMFCSPHLPAEDLRRMCKMLSLSYSLLASTTMNTLERKLYRYAGLALAVIAISLSSICLKVNNNIHSVAWIWTRISMSSITTIYPSRRSLIA